MKTKFYLKVNRTGAISVSKGKPYTEFDQVAVCCNLELPDALFTKPQITASIIVDDKDVKPFEFDAETINNVRDAIETSTGVQVKLTLGEPVTI